MIRLVAAKQSKGRKMLDYKFIYRLAFISIAVIGLILIIYISLTNFVKMEHSYRQVQVHLIDTCIKYDGVIVMDGNDVRCVR